jgi:Fe-S cluster biogenesis protein NfuA
MRIITAADIESMLRTSIEENLKVMSGKGKNQKPIITRGFKIVHLKSGLTYTVDSVVIADGNPVIKAHSGDGEPLEITSKEFKEYKGL